jgi:GH15 family glucan-1,4-alpha-glucosidase
LTEDNEPVSRQPPAALPREAAAGRGPAPDRGPDPREPEPSIYDYGLIGNEKTGALISRFGSVDWACLPRFDSPSVFGRLLDRDRGGFHQVAPRDRYVSHQLYVPGTNLLTTFFELRRGISLILTDFMPMGPPGSSMGGDPRIVRRLVAKGGPIDVTVEAVPRFTYGEFVPDWSTSEGTAAARHDGDRVSFAAPWAWTTEGAGVRASGRVDPGTPAFLQVRWGDPPPAEPSPATLLAVTDAYWRGWVSPVDAPLRRVAARWHPWVERSELVLKLLSYADSGVFVAAPTTSLPEWPGGPRNWDYRFVWIRDAAFTAQVFLLLGHLNEARAYVGWALDRAAELRDGDELRTVYTVDGLPPPDERELSHLEGYRGSRPVRVGNAAADQRQLDIYGEILDSATLLEPVDPAFVRDRWPLIERLAQRAVDLWARPDSGIWEFRTRPAQYVHSKLMCWVALDRAVQLAEAFGKTDPVDRWRRVADEIRATILSRGYDDSLGAFVQAFDRPVVDASALRISLDGLLPANDPRVLSTLAAVERSLCRGAFVQRYASDDGLAGPEGAFLLCSFWRVESLARSGQMDRALEYWRALLDAAGPLLLFSEQFDPVAQQPLGNYPQAFTHIGVLRAAFALGLMSSER